MFVTSALLGIIVCLIAYWYRQRKKVFNLFKDLGIPGPEPNFFFGNSLKLFDPKGSGASSVLAEWTKQYGQYYGYFEGPLPILVTTDLDFIQRFMIKDFKNFSERKRFPLAADPDSDEYISLFLAKTYRWKRLRSIITPVFSSSKMKAMTPLLNNCIDTMLGVLDTKQQDGDSFDIYEIFQELTMDIIGSAAFGIEVNSHTDKDNSFIKSVKQILDAFRPDRPKPLYFPILSLLAVAFPDAPFQIWAKTFHRLQEFFHRGEAVLMEEAQMVLDHRKTSKGAKRVDLLQLMMDAEIDAIDHQEESGMATKEELENIRLTNTAWLGAVGGDRKVQKKLTNYEIRATSALFLIAGFETTSNALAYTAYELAIHPDIQDKIQDEIDRLLSDKIPDYSDVNKLEYLDMVFSEVLRLHPIAPTVIARRCDEPFYLNGLHFPSGTSVSADVNTIHFDPDIWGPTDPKLFNPERFSPEEQAHRHPMAFLTFGAGPKNCVGMRFAHLEAKLALVRLLQKYVIQKSDRTEVPIDKCEGATVTPRNGVHVKLVKRKTTEE